MSVKILKFKEHTSSAIDLADSTNFQKNGYDALFNSENSRNTQDLCFSIHINSKNSNYVVNTSYYVGLDWLDPNQSAIYIAPKLNIASTEIDYSKMLFDALKYPEAINEIKNLVHIQWNKPTIEIYHKDDFLTPFLIAQFMGLMKSIVRKGLKKTYYFVEANLDSRIKGKILIGKTIKKNILQNKYTKTTCRFQKFGIDHNENRLLKKTLMFVKRVISTYKNLDDNENFKNAFNYIDPAFTNIDTTIEVRDIKNIKPSVFYKEYSDALQLAKIILRRFGYNISNTTKKKISTPPFWIDMSKLFEFHVLGLLKNRFHKDVKFQFKTYGNELDFLLNSVDYQMVIDAKYKLKYLTGVNHKDIRQVSGYARLNRVYSELNLDTEQIIECLIIHPDQTEEGLDDLNDVDLRRNKIETYNKIYKLGVRIPTIN